jgi:carbamoyltransferase
LFLQRWSQFVAVSEPDDLAESVASLLANGKVVAWVQGRAEFGARALGNRSILADPRPVKNRQRINDMIKKREGFRPFAPSVLEEYLHQYFEVPEDVESLPFMAFVVNVREQYRAVLGAVTHVDGSARVQSVSRDTNEKYWELISAFHRRTGVPVVLNTSFNNAHEPIVDTPRDAMNCFLSTNLDYLVIGDVIIEKKNNGSMECMIERLIPQISRRFYLCIVARTPGQMEYRVHDRYRDEYRVISKEAYCTLFAAADEQLPLGIALHRLALAETDRVRRELFQLWCERVFSCDTCTESQAATI